MSFPLLLRGFVVLGVMLMHTTWYFSHAHAESWVTISEMLLDIISLFAVPLVMFVSGYMFISHNRHADYYKWSSAGCSCRCFRRICCFRYCIWAVPGFSATPASHLNRPLILSSPAAAPSIWPFSVRYLVFTPSIRCCCVILTAAVCITGCTALSFR